MTGTRRITALAFFVLFFFPNFHLSNTSRIEFKIAYSEASPLKLISMVISAYSLWRRAAKPAQKVVKALRHNCEHLLDAYQSFKGSRHCTDSCGGVAAGAARVACYAKLLRDTNTRIDTMRSELDARSAFEIYCAGPGVGRRKTDTGKRDGDHWKADEGHKQRISELRQQINKCVSLIKSSTSEKNRAMPQSSQPLAQ